LGLKPLEAACNQGTHSHGPAERICGNVRHGDSIPVPPARRIPYIPSIFSQYNQV